MIIGHVASLWRYPVKSMRGEELELASLSERGVVGDRAYALIDQDTGKVASAKHPRLWGRLLACRAVSLALDSPVPVVRISLPDGRTLTTGQDDVEAALSAMLGRAVTLSASPPEGARIERYWPDVAGLALRNTFTVGEIGRGAPPGTFFDHAPVHLLATATLDRLHSLHPARRVVAQRFRPNLLIASGDDADGFVENTWIGRVLLIGAEVRLRVTDPTPRCVVPTLAQGDEPEDVGILRAVAAHNRPPIPALAGATQPSLGAYAVVECGGTIWRGDAVRLGS